MALLSVSISRKDGFSPLDKSEGSDSLAMDLSSPLSVKRIKTMKKSHRNDDHSREQYFLHREMDDDDEDRGHSALHRLAEAAERKQMEDELLELQSGSGRSSSSSNPKFILSHPDSSSDSLLLYPYEGGGGNGSEYSSRANSPKIIEEESLLSGQGEEGQNSSGSSSSIINISSGGGISRQQLINSPCPVCGDKISGFHYGIFSCESCKGFFKRTVQNKKNYVCLRGSQCPVTISTRKKCPACRFEKCLSIGMKLEAIREDRTRGGRSTYQCSSYSLPSGVPGGVCSTNTATIPTLLKREPPECVDLSSAKAAAASVNQSGIPFLLQEIMSVEHLWFWSTVPPSLSSSDESSSPPDPVQTLTLLADKRLYKLVRWCKSLPLFKNILVDDQITLLINAWCELLVFSCCYKSVDSSGTIRLSQEKSLSLESARSHGVHECIEKMLNFSDQLRRLKVDHYEYVSLKVILLLTSDTTGLKEVDHVRDSQEQVVRALQAYTSYHYPSMPSKFGELLLRMPELQRVCQVSRDMLQPTQEGDKNTSPGFNLLMELLRGDH